MNHDLYKLLFDRNPDGSVSYSMEDMEIITEEDNNAQAALRDLILQDYIILLDEIRKRMTGIAKFAYDDEKQAVRISFENNYSEGSCAVVLVYLWGEKLEENQLFKTNDKVGNWTCSDASSHTFYFHLPVTEEISRKSALISLGVSHL